MSVYPNEQLTVSVVIATYNGSKYILEQLESIRNQSRQPDEVIICDDLSTDKTFFMISNFIKKYNLSDRWHLFSNKTRKGHVSNFLDGCLLTKGDIIFFCDQDDIWDTDKIYLMTKCFIFNNNIDIISCTFNVIDASGKIRNSLINYIRKGNKSLSKISFALQVKNNYCIGLALAVRSKVLFNYIKIIKDNKLAHDVPLGLFSSIFGKYYILGVPLVLRRVHSNNVSSPKYSLLSRIRNPIYHIEGRVMHLHLLTVCCNFFKNDINNHDYHLLHKAIGLHERSIVAMKQKKYLKLFLYIFENNPMVSKLLLCANFLISVVGRYNVIHEDL